MNAYHIMMFRFVLRYLLGIPFKKPIMRYIMMHGGPQLIAMLFSEVKNI